MTSLRARRAFAVLIVAACATASLPTAAAVTLLGTVASQPRVPAKLATCSVSVDGDSFSPAIQFAQQPNPVARYTVALAFFDKKNVTTGVVDVTDHGSDSYELPARSDSMTCLIRHLTFDDGSTYPGSGGGNASAGGIALGVLGVGALIGIALSSHHGSSSNNVATTPTPTANPSASPTTTPSAGASATATAVGATATPTATAAGSASPTPSPFPTAPTTVAPTNRPQHVGPRVR